MSVFVRPKVALPPPIEPAVKAGPIGSGAGVLMTEFPLTMILGGRDPRTKMRKAYQLGIEVDWIRAAERTICGAFSSVGWHLEDENDEEIDDEYPDQYAQAARLLLAKPTANLENGQYQSRHDLWWITSRHMGLCGNAFWFLDGLNTYGTPNAVKYLRPDRMTPNEDANGNLRGWWIDRTANDPGISVSLEQVLHFMLEPPDQGHFGIGLVESALIKAQLSLGLDKHLAQVLGGGGRLAGILAPKAGDHLEEPQYQQLVADARTITEQPDAAKRLQVVRGPVDFIQTGMNAFDAAVVQFMQHNEDGLLGLWGVPKSQLGIHDRGRGLQGAEVTAHDEAILWKLAVHPRLGAADQGGFVEVVQGQLLDRWTKLGVAVELEVEEPTFDDDGPKYDQAQKAISVPLRTAERRAILDLEPFGPEVVDPETGLPLDDEIWMPATMVRAFIAPSDGQPIPAPEPEPEPAPMDEASLAAGETSDVPMLKADLDAVYELEDVPDGHETASKAGPPKFVFGRPNPHYYGQVQSDIHAGRLPRAYTAGASREDIQNELNAIRQRAIDKFGKPPSAAKIWATYQRNKRRLNARARRRTATRTATAAPVTRRTAPAVAEAAKAGVPDSFAGLKRTTAERVQPRIAASVAAVLRAQRADIIARVRANLEHVIRKPADATWFDSALFTRQMADALRPHVASLASTVAQHVAEIRPAKADRKLVAAGTAAALAAGESQYTADQYVAAVTTKVLEKGAARVTGITGTTRDMVVGIIRDTVKTGVERGMGMAELGNALEAALGDASAFDEYRSEMIARTETGIAWNEAALDSIREAGIEQVQVLDGDGDDLCAPWANWIGPADEAPEPLGHPNCTRDIIPYFGGA